MLPRLFCRVAFIMLVSIVMRGPSASSVIRKNDELQEVKNRTCTPAEAEPSLNNSRCHPLKHFEKPFCKDHGIALDDHVFRNYEQQIEENRLEGILAMQYEVAFKTFASEDCANLYYFVSCHHFYPRCDDTRSFFQEQKVCRETCRSLFKKCNSSSVDLIKRLYAQEHPPSDFLVNCELQPQRNAGESPECWYYDIDRNADNKRLLVYDTLRQRRRATSLRIISGSYDSPHPHHIRTTCFKNRLHPRPQPHQCSTNIRGKDRRSYWMVLNLNIAHPATNQITTCIGNNVTLNLTGCWASNIVRTDLVPDLLVTRSNFVILDCLYMNGSSYGGNISLTASGIPCQSWTSQCPHRHTMNKTYPELNKAKNHCRNPRNSGEKPWCFTTDRNRRWEYCDIPKCTPVDGNYGNWTRRSRCSVTCGPGYEIWQRNCDNPSPRFGGTSCSHLGNSTEYRTCTRKPCPVNGGYGNWTLSKQCNVSCGQGFEMWQRSCNSPTPRYGGRNCSALGNSTELRQCTKKPCPINGNYGNWTRATPCTVSCGRGLEIWTRKCDNPPPRYGGNCSQQLGLNEKTRRCNHAPCPVAWNTKRIAIFSSVGVAGLLFFILVGAVIRRIIRRKRSDDCSPYAVLTFEPQLNRRINKNLNQEDHTSIVYENTNAEGEPLPGLCRGVVTYERQYVNAESRWKPWYTKLQLFRPIVIDWLRNAWGSVDELGRHVYDVMQRARNELRQYNKLSNVQQNESDERTRGLGTTGQTGAAVYDTFERPRRMLTAVDT